MWPLIKDFVLGFVFDKSAAQRYIAAGAYFAGDFLGSGGVIPGTNTVLPVNEYTWLGPILKGLAVFLIGGGSLPSANGFLTKNGPAAK